MDDRDRLKITRNLSALKERVGADLDPILDKLIERDVFDIRIKDDIDNVMPATPHQKADSLLRKLLRSGKNAYPAFKEVLLERGGLDDLVYKMENTRLDMQYGEVVSNGREPDESSDYDVNEQTYRKTEVSNDKDDFHFQDEKPAESENAAQAGISKEMLKALIDERVDERVDEKVKEMKEQLSMLKATIIALSEERIELLKKIDEQQETMDSSSHKRYKKKYEDKKKEVEELKKRFEKIEKEMNKMRFEATRKDREIQDLKKRTSKTMADEAKQNSDCKAAKFKLREWLKSLRMKVVFPPKYSKNEQKLL